MQATMARESELIVPNEFFDESILKNGSIQETTKKPSIKGSNCSTIFITLALIALAICLAGVATITVVSLAEIKQLQKMLKQYEEITISDKAAQIDSNNTANYQSWQTRAAQIENTVIANQQIILNRAAQIERTVSANEQSWQSKANQIEVNYQSLSNETHLIEKTAAAYFRSIKQRIEKITQTSSNTIINNGGGAVYTRWGHNTCPNVSQVVYTGRVGGTAYSKRGGASNQVCLPEDPQYFPLFRNGSQRHSLMYGSEYEQPLNFVNAATQDNVPCAVCSVTTRQQVLMIPARYTCPPGWTSEYNGFLMSEHIGNYRSTFICVDYEQIPIPNTRVHNLGTDLYHVEADCSNLPCGPYSQDKELSCVVCTK